MSKNVCFLVGDISSAGGTERVVSVLANVLDSSGINVSIISLKTSGLPHFSLNSCVKSETLLSGSESISKNYLKVLFLLRLFVKKNNIDILVNVESLLCIFSIPSLPFTNVKNICWEHFNVEIDLGVKSRRLARWLATKFSDHIVVLSDWDKSKWKEKYGKSIKISRIYNPLTIDNKNTNYIEKKKYILAVGRLTHQKGFDLLLKSWAKIKNKNGWKLLIAGEGEDGASLIKLTEKLSIADDTRFLGYVEDIGKYFEKSSIFALSSRFEGFGLVITEALINRIAVISFDCPAGPSEIIETGFNGYLIKNGDIDSFAQTLNEMMSNPTLINDFAKNAGTSLQKFEVDNIKMQWVKLFNSFWKKQ